MYGGNSSTPNEFAANQPFLGTSQYSSDSQLRQQREEEEMNSQHPQQSSYSQSYYGGTSESQYLNSTPLGYQAGISPHSASLSNSNHFGSSGPTTATQPGRFDNVDISGRRQGFNDSEATPFERVHEFVSLSNRRFQNFLDSTTPHSGPRWAVFAFLLFVFVIRIILKQGFYVIAYALGIYLLNIFLLFLSPKFDPAFSEDESALDNEADIHDDPNLGLPTLSDSAANPIDEFRPFIRRLPEFKFWHTAISAVLIGLFCTIFPFLDIPVFWPILLMYFVLLFALTMRRQIQHMIKYKYLPFDIGKKAFA